MYKRTNIELDQELVKRAMKATKLNTIKDVVNYSLSEIVKMNTRKSFLKLKGKVNWEGNLDQMREI